MPPINCTVIIIRTGPKPRHNAWARARAEREPNSYASFTNLRQPSTSSFHQSLVAASLHRRAPYQKPFAFPFFFSFSRPLQSLHHICRLPDDSFVQLAEQQLGAARATVWSQECGLLAAALAAHVWRFHNQECAPGIADRVGAAVSDLHHSWYVFYTWYPSPRDTHRAEWIS